MRNYLIVGITLLSIFLVFSAFAEDNNGCAELRSCVKNCTEIMNCTAFLDCLQNCTMPQNATTLAGLNATNLLGQNTTGLNVDRSLYGSIAAISSATHRQRQSVIGNLG